MTAKTDKATVSEIDPAVIGEALIPDLTADTFEVLGKTIRIKPLLLRNSIELGKMLAPFSKDAAYEVQTTGGVLTGIAEALYHLELVPQIILLMAKNDGVELTEDELLDSDIQIHDLIPHIIALSRKNEQVCKPIVDFFQRVIPIGKADVEKMATLMVETAKARIQKALSKYTTS